VLTIKQIDPPAVSGTVQVHLIADDAPVALLQTIGARLELVDPSDATKTFQANLIAVQNSGTLLVIVPLTPLIAPPTTQTRVRVLPPTDSGRRRGVSVYAAGELISPFTTLDRRRRIVFGDLCQWADPDPGTLVIDVRLGRFAFAPGETPGDPITVNFNYGFSGDIGAGPYDRMLLDAPTAAITLGGALSLDQALTDWQTNAPAEAIIEIQDSRTYTLALTSLAMPSARFHLTLRAMSGERPTIILFGDLQLTGGDASSSITLDGLFLSGGAIDVQGVLEQLTICNCTLDPGGGLSADGVTLRPGQTSLSVAANGTPLTVAIDHSIIGALRVPNTIEHLHLADSIVDAQQGIAISGPAGAGDFAARSTIEATTILG
jgi:hypothetical protein